MLTDRDRIARDLHDHVIQRLFAVGLALQGTIPRAQVSRSAATAYGFRRRSSGSHSGDSYGIFDLHGRVIGGNPVRQRLDEAIAQFSTPSCAPPRSTAVRSR